MYVSDTKMKFNCVYTYWWRYLAGILNKQKITAEGKLSLWFLRMARSFIIIVFCFVYIGETSHATSVCMSLSLPCTVMIFNIVGISQGYVTRNKRSDSSAVLRDAIIQPTQFSTTPTTSQNVQQQSQYHSPPFPASHYRILQPVQTEPICTSEKEVCLPGNYSKFQLPNKGKQTVVSIGEFRETMKGVDWHVLVITKN